MNLPRYFLIIPAAGSGHRMGAAWPKQYLDLLGKPVLQHTLERLLALPVFAKVVIAADNNDAELQKIIRALPLQQQSLLQLTTGGPERAQSVLNALTVLATQAQADDWVLVHDAVRPCVRQADVQNLIQELQYETAGGLLALPMRDTIKRATGDQQVEQTLDRSTLWSAATPQMFRYGLLTQAIKQGLEQGLSLTDEASAVEALGLPVRLVAGHTDNIKITYSHDLILAAALLSAQEEAQKNARQ